MGLYPDEAPNGVYIQHSESNKLYLAEQWNTDWNKYANGTVVISNVISLVIAPNTISYKECWQNPNSDAGLISGVTTETDKYSAYDDYNGKTNSNLIMQAQLEYGGNAAWACSLYKFKNGKSGYLGACGEWRQIINNHKTAVNKCQSLIEGHTLVSGSYWTSTQVDKGSAWRMNAYDATASQALKSEEYFVIAFADLK